MKSAMLKILVISPSSIGDAIMIEPLLRRLREQHPDAAIDVLAPAAIVPLLWRMAEIGRAIPNPLADGEFSLKACWRLARQLKREGYGRAIVLPSSFAAALIPFLAGIPLRTGFRGAMRYILLNDLHSQDKKASAPTVERFVSLAGRRHVDSQHPIGHPRLRTEMSHVRTTLAKLALAPASPVVACCVGAEGGPARRWPAHHFAELAWSLAGAGYEVWLLGSDEDVEIGAEIERLLAAARVKTAIRDGHGKAHKFHNLCGKADLAETVDLLAVARASVVNDSGLMHVAAALGKPMFALYGSTSPSVSPPLSDQARIISLHLPCSPCLKRECPLGHFDCMKQLHPQRVFDDILAAVHRQPQTPAPEKARTEALPQNKVAQAPAAPIREIPHRPTPAAAAPRAGRTSGFEFIEGLATELSSKKLVFPTSINITMRIRQALHDPNASTDKIVHIVGAEPVLSAQLLRLCNAAAFSTGGKAVSDLHTAVVRLGYTMVQNVAISVGMRQLMEGKAHGITPPVIEGVWKRSIRVAALCFVIARKLTQINADTAMLAGLLHDIGKFYILNRARDFPDLFNNETALWEVVDQWHANVGEAILESWEIPQEIDIAVRDHRDTQRTHRGPADLTDIVTAADFLDGVHHAGKIQDLDWDAVPSALTRLNLQIESCKALMQEAKEELGQIIHAFD
jgi:heptosyltransferase-2